jgi:hypothetical protein
MVEGGEIVHPASTDFAPPLDADLALVAPFELSLEVMLVGRRREDAGTVRFFDGERDIQVWLDNQPGEFELLSRPERIRRTAVYAFVDGSWNRLRCKFEANGRVRTILNEVVVLEADWRGTNPLRVGLECQRSGGRFRNLLEQDEDLVGDRPCRSDFGKAVGPDHQSELLFVRRKADIQARPSASVSSTIGGELAPTSMRAPGIG